MELGFGIVDLEPGNDNSDLPALAPLVAAIAVPITLAACLIPVRGQLEHSAGMILVLPVIYCGVRFGAIPGIVAALSAAMGFDLFHLPPFLTPRIGRLEDIVAGVTLLVVGIVVGATGSHLARVNRRSGKRLRELSILETHADMVTRQHDEVSDYLNVIDGTALNLTELLRLRSCRWEPMTDWDPMLTLGQPTLLDNGQIIGRLEALPQDRSRLPNPVELVVASEGRPFGRFLLEPDEARTSIEERRIAATLCRLTAAYLAAKEQQ